MFENLSDKLQRSFKNLRGQGTISEENVSEALREIRTALLESDVNLDVVKSTVDHIREKAIGAQVATSLSPAEQLVKIVSDELQNILGKDTARFKFSSQPPSVILMAGLQGSGKTTTSGKLAQWLKKGGHRPMLVSVDVYRPAAREQLRVVAESIKTPIYQGTLDAPAGKLSSFTEGGGSASPTQAPGESLSSFATGGGSASLPKTPGTPDVLRLAREALRDARNFGCDILLVDTAGRLGIDQLLMDEMAQLKAELKPSEILFVADAMTGQDAVRSAKAFNDRLGITGVVLTKMDGDARGGAALSIRHVTGAPIKFLGTGEKPDAFEPFHPDRIVSRIMGHGDIATLLERAEERLDRGKAEQFAKKALSGDGFTLDDFREQLRQIKKMGSMKSILKMLPSVGPFAGMAQAAENVDENQFTRVESIINSMTNRERQDHEIINGSRRKRIAAGSGTTVQEVNNLLRQYAQMRKMFKSIGGGGGMKMQQRMMAQMQGKQRFGR